MTTNRRRSAAGIVFSVIKALLIGLALLFLAEYFGWRLFREAGGAQFSAAWNGPWAGPSTQA